MSKRDMSRVGTVVAVVMAVSGLVVVAFFVYVSIALSHFGSST